VPCIPCNSFQDLEIHHPIATKSPEAQKFFDQGLALAWAFNRAEAERSFRRAAELDPSVAMPWWGAVEPAAQTRNCERFT